jgi:hypothetical protein
MNKYFIELKKELRKGYNRISSVLVEKLGGNG